MYFSEFHSFVVDLLRNYPAAKFSFFGHYQDGNVHLNISIPSELDGDELTEKVLREVCRLGGAIAAEHGLGRRKRMVVSPFLDPQVDTLRENLKSFFDRERILA